MHTSSIQPNFVKSSLKDNLWFQWTLATTLGEFVGFAVPALVGTLVMAAGLPDLVLFILIIPAGIIEGSILGFAQARILRRYFPAQIQRQWIVATAMAAGLAYITWMLPVNLGDLSRFGLLVLITGGIVLGVVFLALMGTAQWLVLRHYLPHSGSWIVANAIAWPLGVLVPVVGIMLVPDEAVAVVFVIVGILCGILMGVVVGAITGIELKRLLQKELNKPGSNI